MKINHNKNMKKRKIKKIVSFLMPITILLIISILNMYGASFISNLYVSSFKKQIIWIILSIIVGIVIYKIDIRFFLKNAFVFYIIGCILLVLVLFIGANVNGASSWFRLGPFSFQPSEVFKFFFLIFASNLATKGDGRIKSFFKIILITFIPSILIFLEPDTGVVIMYLLIMIGVILGSNIKKRYLGLMIITGIVFLGMFFGMYFLEKDTFINIFGTSFFYRIDRLLSFKNNSSYQLNNALIGLGASGALGFGLIHPKIYVPEITTDFVFDLSILNFGYLVGITIVLLYVFILLKIYQEKINSNNAFNKCILSGIFWMMSFQVFEHILMNIGLTPITGITLPFLSYGGSSMLSYMMLLSLILKITTNNSSYTPD